MKLIILFFVCMLVVACSSEMKQKNIVYQANVKLLLTGDTTLVSDRELDTYRLGDSVMVQWPYRFKSTFLCRFDYQHDTVLTPGFGSQIYIWRAVLVESPRPEK